MAVSTSPPLLNVYLLGKQGCGKSATGNTLLQKKAFVSKASKNAVTTKPQKGSTTVSNRQIYIWDGPGVTEVQLHTDRTVEWLKKAIDQRKSNDNILLWVVSYRDLCGKGDAYLLRALMKTLGEAFVKEHTIVAVTHKDSFDSNIEDPGLTFNNWVQQQTGVFKKLCFLCGHKIFPIDNSLKSEEQVEKIFQCLLQEPSETASSSDIATVDRPVKSPSPTSQPPIASTSSSSSQEIRHAPTAPTSGSAEQQDNCTKMTYLPDGPKDNIQSGIATVDHPVKSPSSTSQPPIPLTSSSSNQEIRHTPTEPTTGSVEQQDHSTKMTNLPDGPKNNNQMSSSDLDIMLLGKTGAGKSKTGNAILDRKAFSSVASTSSATIESQKEVTMLETGRKLLVVDTPGVADNRGTKEDGEKLFMKAIQEAIVSNPAGYHALVLVVRFGARFTQEDVEMIKYLKNVFGEKFIAQHCIMVMSFGDLFYRAQEEGDIEMGFMEWCKEQTGAFQILFKEVKERILLFNNGGSPEEKAKQRNELVAMIDKLMVGGRRYTDAKFEKARQEMEQQILDKKISRISQQVQEEISLIQQEQDRVKMKQNIDEQIKALGDILNKIRTILTRIDQEETQTTDLLKLRSVVKEREHGVEMDINTLSFKKELSAVTRDDQSKSKNIEELRKKLSEMECKFDKVDAETTRLKLENKEGLQKLKNMEEVQKLKNMEEVQKLKNMEERQKLKDMEEVQKLKNMEELQKLKKMKELERKLSEMERESKEVNAQATKIYQKVRDENNSSLGSRIMNGVKSFFTGWW